MVKTYDKKFNVTLNKSLLEETDTQEKTIVKTYNLTSLQAEKTRIEALIAEANKLGIK